MASAPDTSSAAPLSKVLDLLTKTTVIVACITGVCAYFATEQRDADQSMDKKRELQ